MPLTIPLTILLATAGLAALAFTLLYLHAASLSRETLDDDALAVIVAFYAVDEADTQPLENVAGARPGDNLGEQSA